MAETEQPSTQTGQPFVVETDATPDRPTEVDATQPIEWTASEFIAHEKSANWYGGLAATTAGLVGIILLLTQDFISASVVVFGAVLFGIYANRKPRQLPYRLDRHNLRIGQRSYSLQQFRSFSVVPEGVFSSIVLMPLRRFSPLTTIYYAPEDEERIVAVLSQHLPYAAYKHDMIERLMRQIRF